MTKRICIVTGTRAEYGLLRWVMEGIRQSPALELQLIATGMHLSPEFGLTVEAIEADGFQVDRKVEMLLSSDTAVGVTKSMGLGMIGFADALAELRPDLMLLLGDRYEIFAAAAAAMIARVPIAHLHGGETTQGAFDEAIRHSITKMSHLHFVAADEYRRRVIQLGEQPDRVFQVGGLGIDNILRLNLLGRDELETALDFKLASRNLLITFHPVTLEHNSSAAQMDELLAALAARQDTGLIFTMPNADTDGRGLFRQIEGFCARHANARAYTSLGQLRYLSCIQHVDGVVGNSSSGLAEAPSFNKGTINIGDRQRGRLRAASVIDCEPDRASIGAALDRLLSPAFQAQLPGVQNLYGNGGASDAIVKILEQRSLDDLLKKRFHDLPNPRRSRLSTQSPIPRVLCAVRQPRTRPASPATVQGPRSGPKQATAPMTSSPEQAGRKALLPPEAILQEAIRTLNDAAIRIALVVDTGGVLIGTINDGDIRKRSRPPASSPRCITTEAVAAGIHRVDPGLRSRRR